MSPFRDKGARHDVFFKKAREQGFAARAVFKLKDLDKKLGLLRGGDRVLDLGCRPGSWLQYAAQRVGVYGKLVAIDRLPMPTEIPRARIHLADVYETPDAVLVGDLGAFDVVLSDMAPDTMGIKNVEPLRKRMQKVFSPVRLIKPDASRKISTEIYLAGKGFIPASS